MRNGLYSIHIHMLYGVRGRGWVEGDEGTVEICTQVVIYQFQKETLPLKPRVLRKDAALTSLSSRSVATR